MQQCDDLGMRIDEDDDDRRISMISVAVHLDRAWTFGRDAMGVPTRDTVTGYLSSSDITMRSDYSHLVSLLYSFRMYSIIVSADHIPLVTS